MAVRQLKDEHAVAAKNSRLKQMWQAVHAKPYI